MNFIELEREASHSNYLIQELIMNGVMQRDMVLVNCAPEYSSRLTQLINHKTSYLNKNELYEQISLDLPKKGMNQVLSYDEKEFISFDRYLSEWINRYVTKDAKFLFVQNVVHTGKHLNKIWLSLKSKLENLDNMKFVSLYVQEDALMTTIPNFIYQQKFQKENPPIFFWENTNIK